MFRCRHPVPFACRPVIAGLLLASLLAGCATPRPEESFEQVAQLLNERGLATPRWLRNTADDAAADAAVRQLLKKPLDAEAAIQIALLNNRGLQVRYADLAVNQADLVQAGLLSNPVFSAGRAGGGSLTNIGIGLELNFLGLLMLPVSRKIDAAKQEATKFNIGAQIIDTAHEVRVAWVEALAAKQYRRFLENRLDEPLPGNTLRDRLFASELQAEYYQAQATEAAARESLTRLMGLTIEQTGWQLPDSLPSLPEAEPRWQGLEEQAMSERFDIVSARHEIQAVQIVLGVTRKNHHIRSMDIGVSTTLSSGETSVSGPSVALELPVFQRNDTKISRTEALLRQAEDRLLERGTIARSEVRAAQNRLAALWKLGQTQNRDTLPLAAALTTLPNVDPVGRYLDRLQSLRAHQRQVELTRDYWRAYSDLNRAVGGKLPAALASSVPKEDSGPVITPLQAPTPLG